MNRGWPGEPVPGGALPQLGASLGRGFLGECFAARCGVTGLRIAVKRMDAALAVDAIFLRFEMEVLPRVRELSRPGIVPVSMPLRIGEHPSVAMPFFAGEDVTRYRGRPLGEILAAFDPLLTALQAVHEAGLVHGGLRASNLLCDDAGEIQLADLGFAALIHQLPGPREARLASAGPELSPALRAGADAPAVADDIFALGALLYESVAARPPPPVLGDGPRVLPPLSLPGGKEGSVPRRLSVLVASMLHADSSARPAGLAEVQETLRGIGDGLTADTPSVATTWSAATQRDPAAERGEGAGASDSGNARPASGTMPEPSRNQRTAWFALLGLILVGAVGLVWLQSSVQRGGAYGGPPTPSPKLEAGAQVTTAPSFADERRRAVLTEQQAVLTQRLDALSARNAPDWAGEPYTASQQTLGELQNAIRRGDLEAAASALARGEALVDGLETTASRLLAESLQSGAEALARGDAQEATAQFERVGLLEPENETARAGLARAARLPEVLALLEEAERESDRGQYEAGLERVRQALALDSESEPAQAALRQLEERRTDANFRVAMSDALAAIERGEPKAARAALDRAGRLRPGDPALRDARARIDAEAQRVALGLLRARARRFEAEERWAEAVGAYEAALARDAGADFAKAALPNARERAALDQTLTAFSANTANVFSRSGRVEATRALDAGQRVTDPGPRLAQQLAVLGEALKLASTPVAVGLVSDQQTQVTIYHVGVQGRFLRKELRLLPGSYTVVGAREGFRDVRRQLEVHPGNSAELSIRCEEAL